MYKLRKGRNYEEVIMGEILLRIIIAAASAALLTTEGAKKMGKDDDNSTFFTIFAVEFETAYENASDVTFTHETAN